MSNVSNVADQVSQVAETFIGLSPMDVLALVIAVALAVTCFLRGFSKKFLHFMGWIAAIAGGLYGQQWLSSYLTDIISNPRIRAFVTIILLTGIIFILFRKLGSVLSKAIEGTALSSLDKSLGLLFGIFQSYLLFSAVYLGAFIMTEGNLPKFFDQARIKPYSLYGAEVMRKLIPEELRPEQEIKGDIKNTTQLAQNIAAEE